jgi:threonine/homoserine/homoserine lactone efflux protein
MLDLPLLAAFWAAFLLALVSPGPNFALIAGTALREGRRRAVGTAFGLAAGEAVWAIAAVLGVSALAAQHPLFAAALRIGGGAFLLYLGLTSLRSALRGRQGEEPPAEAVPARTGTGFWRGAGLMLLNPKAGVFWVSLSGLFLGTGTAPGTAAAAVAGAVVLSILWHGALAWLLSAAAVAAAFRRVRRLLDGLFGVVLTALGLRMVASN